MGSQNHRMVEVGKDLWRSSGPTPCSSRATQSQLPRTMFRRYLNIAKEGDHNLLQQPVPGLSHPHSEKVFPDVQAEPPVFQFVPIVSGPVAGHHCKEPGSAFFTSSLHVLIYIDKIPPEPSLLQAPQHNESRYGGHLDLEVADGVGQTERQNQL